MSENFFNLHQGNWGHLDPMGLHFLISPICFGLRPYATMTLSHYVRYVNRIDIISMWLIYAEIKKIMLVGSI